MRGLYQYLTTKQTAAPASGAFLLLMGLPVVAFIALVTAVTLGYSL